MSYREPLIRTSLPSRQVRVGFTEYPDDGRFRLQRGLDVSERPPIQLVRTHNVELNRPVFQMKGALPVLDGTAQVGRR